MLGEVGATIVLGRLRALGPAGCVAECAALQLTARSVRPNERGALRTFGVRSDQSAPTVQGR